MRDSLGKFIKGSAINKGRVVTDAQKKKQSDAMSGRTLTKEHKEKIRAGMLKAKENGIAIGHRVGEPSWNKGVSIDASHLHTAEIRKKISKSNTGKKASAETKKKLSEIVKKWWKDPANAKKCLVFNSPNKQEQKLNKLLDKMYPGQWMFVGNGEFIIDGKCPDFITTNKDKKIIELYGERWHEPHEEQERIDFFKQHGYETLIIWCQQLNKSGLAEKMIREFNATTTRRR